MLTSQCSRRLSNQALRLNRWPSDASLNFMRTRLLQATLALAIGG
jgi:hypothetical protein